jgi:hypothetical protein
MAGDVMSGALLPALGKILRLCLGNELTDDLGGRLIEVRGQIFELLPRRIIESQHEACVIGAGIVGTSVRSFFLPACREIRDGDPTHHVAEPRRGLHSHSNRCLLNSLMEFRCDVEIEVMDFDNVASHREGGESTLFD